MANLTTDMTNKVNSGANDFKNRVLNGEHQIERMAHDAGDTIREKASEFANSAEDTMNASRNYVRANPAKGIAIAATAGLLAGSLLTMILRARKV